MRACEIAKETLDKTSKAAVVHPTETGKSFIAFKWIENHPNMRFVGLSPSDYICKTQIENVFKASPNFPIDQIAFLAYAKLMLMTEEEIAQPQLDGIVLDEFHLCGAKGWVTGVVRLLSVFQDAQILGLSAIKVRYLEGRCDMAEELFAGGDSEMTLAEAIVRGILPAPVYDRKRIGGVSAQNRWNSISIRSYGQSKAYG